MKLEKKDDAIIAKLVIFLIWPFGSFLYSLRSAKTKSSQIIFYLFMVLFGWTFIAETEAIDSYRYLQKYEIFLNNPIANYLNALESYVTFDGGVKDIYLQLCFLITSVVAGGNYHALFALFASVFAFFYIKSLRFMLNNKLFDYSIPAVIVVVCFTLSNTIFNINGVRYWTAGWVFVFACFSFLISGNKKLLLLLLLAPLIHIAFIIPVVLFAIWRFAGISVTVLTVGYGVSFFIGSVSELVLSKMSLFPPVIQKLLDSYLASGLEAIDSNKSWYGQILIRLPYFYLNALVIFFLMNSKVLMSHKMSKRVFTFVLVMFSFVNLVYSLPSIGGRMLQLTIPFLMFLVLIWKDRIPNLNYFIYLIPLVFFRPIYVWFQNVAMVSDPALYISNLFHIIIKNLS